MAEVAGAAAPLTVHVYDAGGHAGSSLIVMRGHSSLIAGHTVAGLGRATPAARTAGSHAAAPAGETPSRRGWAGAEIEGGVAHGVNSAGLLAAVGALPGLGAGVEAAPALVRGGMQDSATVGDALVTLSGLHESLPLAPGTVLLLADRFEAACVTTAEHHGLSATRIGGDPLPPGEDDPGRRAERIAALMARLRTHDGEPSAAGQPGLCRHGAPRTTSALVAALEGPGADGAEVMLCPGTPCVGVFVRLWPGLEPGAPGAFSTPGGAGPASDAAPGLTGMIEALDRQTAGDPDRRAAARLQLDSLQDELLAEAGAAQRMARQMDLDGDDGGAHVRRLLAHAFALERITAAYARLLDPVS